MPRKRASSTLGVEQNSFRPIMALKTLQQVRQFSRDQWLLRYIALLSIDNFRRPSKPIGILTLQPFIHSSDLYMYYLTEVVNLKHIFEYLKRLQVNSPTGQLSEGKIVRNMERVRVS